jgi:ubiquinone/menaquinone biosynthesis C-methylase UbiE
MRLLVACAGTLDQRVLSAAGFTSVTISNLDSRLSGNEFAPYAWSYQDVERLTFADNEFDFAVVHNGLHHCYSPHRGLLELYRVARKGVLVFEPRDTLLGHLAVRLNFGQTYEVAAVCHNELEFGGVGNTHIPNYVYRWNEREVEKTILSYAPYGKHRFQYMYALRIPWKRLRSLRNQTFARTIEAGLPALQLMFRVLPKQSNGFAFVVQKPQLPRDLHPWLVMRADHVDVRPEWMNERYADGPPPR